MPPFAGVLRNLYDISDYEDLKLTKTELENYALLVMKLGIDKDGNWLMDYQKAVEFWQNLDQVMPEEIGSVLSPMCCCPEHYQKYMQEVFDARNPVSVSEKNKKQRGPAHDRVNTDAVPANNE